MKAVPEGDSRLLAPEAPEALLTQNRAKGQVCATHRTKAFSEAESNFCIHRIVECGDDMTPPLHTHTPGPFWELELNPKGAGIIRSLYPSGLWKGIARR